MTPPAIDISEEAAEKRARILESLDVGGPIKNGMLDDGAKLIRALRTELTHATEALIAEQLNTERLQSALTASEKLATDADWLIKHVSYRDDNRRNVWDDIKRMYDEDQAILAKGETK